MLGIKEAMRIARNVRPDLQSCDEELHAFVFYTGDEFYGDRVVILKGDGRAVDFYDGYINVYGREPMAPKARYVFDGKRIGVMRFHYCPRDFDRWDTPPNGVGIRLIPSSLTSAHIAAMRESDEQYAAMMEKKRRQRRYRRPRWN